MMQTRATRAAALGLLSLALAGCGTLLDAAVEQTTERGELPAGAYRLDRDHAALLFSVDHLGFSRFVGRFDAFDASLDFDPERPGDSTLTVVVETASLDVNPASFADDLKGPDWFAVQRYPEARFESRRIEITGETTGEVEGDLTLHGVTRPVTLAITFNGGGDNPLTGAYTLGFAATGTILRSDFGLGRYAPAVSDEVRLEISAEFQAVSEAPTS